MGGYECKLLSSGRYTNLPLYTFDLYTGCHDSFLLNATHNAKTLGFAILSAPLKGCTDDQGCKLRWQRACLTSVKLDPWHHIKLSVMSHACNACTLQLEARGSEVQSHP